MTKLSVTVGALLLTVCGGCNSGPWGKRAQESSCPTDVRKAHCWCWGEDAIFECPCGPDEAYHGYKPTCWHDWQAPAAVWRDEHCGGQCTMSQTTGMEIISERTVAPIVGPMPEGAPSFNGRPEFPSPEAEEVEQLPSFDEPAPDEQVIPDLTWRMAPLATSAPRHIPLVESASYQPEKVVYEPQLEVKPQPERLPTAHGFGFKIIR